jgi:hypothetical protein
MEKIALVEMRKSVERDPACCGRFPLQASQRRCSRSFVGSELVSSLWFASLALISSIFTLLPLDLLGVLVFECRDHHPACDHLQEPLKN